VVMITIWLTTMILASVAVASIVFGYQFAIEVLLVPVAALFAFPQLRTTLPGLPDVSAVDYACFQPCLGILSFSAVLTIVVGIFWDPERRRESLFSKILRLGQGAGSAEPRVVSMGSTWYV